MLGYGFISSGILVKGGDDLRQELLASQLVQQFKAIFDEARLPLWLRPYEILVTGSNSGKHFMISLYVYECMAFVMPHRATYRFAFRPFPIVFSLLSQVSWSASQTLALSMS